MPFRSDPFIGTHNPDQLRNLQKAYDATCKLLGRSSLSEAEARKLAKKRAEQVAMHYLKRVKIPEQANKYPGSLQVVSSNVWRLHVHFP